MEAKKVTIKLRRDTINNYASHPNHIPLKGEVCIVDPTATTPWAKTRNIRFKIGDGVTAWKDLDYVDQGTSNIIYGYYKNGKFYVDINHQQEIEEFEWNMLYLDLHSGVLYYYEDNVLKANHVLIPGASSTEAGIMKLYQKLGYNTDGTMSQKAITDALKSIQLVVDEDDPEAFALSKIKID